MLNHAFGPVGDWERRAFGRRFVRFMNMVKVAAPALALLIGATGCKTPAPQFNPYAEEVPAIVLREGDVVQIGFPGAANLNTTAQIRRDGRITLPLIGEFKASGLTPGEMEKELLKLYGSQLVTKEVTVTVQSSSYPVFLTGAVMRPGKMMCDRPLTALEAVLEAGVDHGKANLKEVVVIREENGHTKRHTLNLKRLLEGEGGDRFELKPSDIIYVPEKFSWF